MDIFLIRSSDGKNYIRTFSTVYSWILIQIQKSHRQKIHLKSQVWTKTNIIRGIKNQLGTTSNNCPGITKTGVFPKILGQSFLIMKRSRRKTDTHACANTQF